MPNELNDDKLPVENPPLEAEPLEEERELEQSSMRSIGIFGYIAAVPLIIYRPRLGILFLLILVIATKWPPNATRRLARKAGRSWRAWNKS